MRARVAAWPLGMLALVTWAGLTPAPVMSAQARAERAPAVAAEGQLATVLSSVVTAPGGDGTTAVILKGNGRLAPKTVEPAKDAPPRLLIDLPGVKSSVPAVTQVGQAPVRRVRVGLNSASPLVTRVVIDLTKHVGWHVDANGSELKIVLEDKPAAEAGKAAQASPSPAAAPAAEKTTKPAPQKTAAASPAPEAKRAASSPASSPAPEKKVATAAPAATPAKAAAAPAKPASPAKTTAPSKTGATAPAAAKSASAPEKLLPTPALAASGSAPSRASVARPAATDVRPASASSESVDKAAARTAEFTGNPVSLDFQGVDLRAVLRTFAEITGLNLVVDPAVQGTVDVSLRDVPWDQALDIILRANQLGYVVDGTVVRIAPLKVLADEETQRRKLAEEKALSGELQLYTRALNYAKANEIEPLLKGVLSTRGRTTVDTRTNTIIVHDLPEYLTNVQTLIQTLDVPEQQVEIEARIIQTSRSFARDLGLKWGFGGRAVPELGNTLPVAFPNSIDGSGSAGTTDPNAPNRARIDLGSINGSFNLNLELSALEREGKIRILLTPRVVTQNNVKAVITRGQEIPYTTTTAAPPASGGISFIQPIPTVQFKTAALTLSVTPRITEAGTVILDIDVDNGSPGEAQPNGNIAINTQRVQTRVLVKDGATTVIGGINSLDERFTEDRTPGLSRLPLLGRLFKSKVSDKEDSELLIFITPRILPVN